MLRFTSAGLLGFVVGVVLGYDLTCLQTTIDHDNAQGYVSIAVNAEGDKAFVIEDVKDTTSHITLLSQQNHGKDSQVCRVLTEKTNLESCSIYKFEVFGKSYIALAGNYRYEGQKNIYSQYGYLVCQQSSDLVPGKSDFCNRDSFFFSPKKKTCAPEMTFVVQARIAREDCVNDLHTLIRLRSYTASLFLVPATLVESSLNDPNIRLVRSESYYKGQDDLNRACEHLRYQVKHDQDGLGFKSCHNLYLDIYGKPYTVMYGVRDEVLPFKHGGPVTIKKITTDSDWMQCQEGHDVNP